MTPDVTSRAARRGRPPAPLDPSASHAARFGAELRAHREAEKLTLQALSARIQYSAQHISQIERGRASVTEVFVRACDAELGTGGALMRFLPEVVLEHHKIRSSRVAARRGIDIDSGPQDGVDAERSPSHNSPDQPSPPANSANSRPHWAQGHPERPRRHRCRLVAATRRPWRHLPRQCRPAPVR